MAVATRPAWAEVPDELRARWVAAWDLAHATSPPNWSRVPASSRPPHARQTQMAPEPTRPPEAPPCPAEATERPLAPVSTSRRWWRPSGRLPAFCDRGARMLVDAGGATLGRIPAKATPATILRALPDTVAAVFLTGPPPAVGTEAMFAWAQRTGDDEWTPEHHRLGRTDSFVLSYRHRDGRRVRIARAAQWFGDRELDARQAAAAWSTLRDQVAYRFASAELMSTPAIAGGHLLLAIAPKGVGWPVLDAADRQMIRDTLTGPRIQVCWEGGELERLVHLDGRLMYPALARNLPCGPIVVDELEHLPTRADGTPDFYAPARYYVDVEAPPGWRHVGLVGVRDCDGLAWPTEGRHRAWVDGAELQLLERWGWRWHVRRRVLFTRYRGRGPLDGWSERLLAIRDQGAHDDPVVVDAVRNAARTIAIQGIGLMVSAGSMVTRSCPIDRPGELESAKAEGRTIRRVRPEGDRLVWEEEGGWEQLAHPEWAASLYAKARVRLLDGPGDTGALHVPYADVVGFHTDCIYLTRDPGWADDGRPGRFRVKRNIAGPITAPASIDDLTRGRQGQQGGDDDGSA